MLLEACLCRSHTLAQPNPGYSARHPSLEQVLPSPLHHTSATRVLSLRDAA